MKNTILRIVLFVIIYLTITQIVINNQSYFGEFNWRSSLWSDQAGYYAYNPAFFVYDFEVDKFPENISANTGWGFEVKSGKFETRYTYGVALLQSPFFLLTHSYNKLTGRNLDGFTENYSRVPIYASIFYLMLALTVLFQILRRKHNTIIALASLAIIFFGTNLYFYFLNYSGFSHVYSFFLFTIFISQIIKYRSKNHFIQLAIAAMVLSFCIVIRPTNILMGLGVFMFWDKETFQSLTNHLNFKNVCIILIIGILPFVPQFAYWYHLSGKLIYYSYGSKGFTYWASPQLLKTWFSPKNGLFPYNPIYLGFVIIWLKLFKRENYGLISFLIFGLLSYLCASWYMYDFGCGYGNRNFIEYTSFFVFPIAAFANLKMNKLFKYTVYTILILGIMVNMKLAKSYDFCFQGNEWEFNEYQKILTRGFYSKTLSIEDKESNLEYDVLDSSWSSSPFIIVKQEKVSSASFGKCKVDAVVKGPTKMPIEVLMVLAIDSAGQGVNWQASSIGPKLKTYNQWENVQWTFTLPKDYPSNSLINYYLWAPKGDSLYVRELSLSLQ